MLTQVPCIGNKQHGFELLGLTVSFAPLAL